MKKEYSNPLTEILKVHNIPVEMQASIESTSAADLKNMKVGGAGFPTSDPKKVI